MNKRAKFNQKQHGDAAQLLNFIPKNTPYDQKLFWLNVLIFSAMLLDGTQASTRPDSANGPILTNNNALQNSRSRISSNATLSRQSLNKPDMQQPSNSIGFFNTGSSNAHFLNRKNIGATKILDFWGEGRIVDGDLITGFEDAYNVNHPEQAISNGSNTGQRIPNKICTTDYNDVDLSSQIAPSTFQYVTLMGAPVTENAAREMYRLVRKDMSAAIVVYDITPNALNTLQRASQDDFIFLNHSQHFITSLDEELKTPNIRPIQLFLTIDAMLDYLKATLESDQIEYACNIVQDVDEYLSQEYSKSDCLMQRLQQMANEEPALDGILQSYLSHRNQMLSADPSSGDSIAKFSSGR